MDIFENSWSFYNPTQIEAGAGAIEKLPQLMPVGGKGLLVTSPGFSKRGVTGKVRAYLAPGPVEVFDAVDPNPDLGAVETCRQQFSGRDINYVVAIGGGSVLDTAKALSFLLSVKDEAFTLRGHLVEKAVLPKATPLNLIAIPTTAGTGSEVTPFATIWDHGARKKYSLAADNLHPTVALLDPELTLTLPEKDTIMTGLDALSHALESVWNRKANPVSLSYAARAIDLVLTALPQLVQNLEDVKLRAKLLTASLFGGLCISSTRTALAHSISYPVTANLGVPHGLACGFTLPALYQFNLAADDGRFGEVAQMVGSNSPKELAERIELLFGQLQVGKLVAEYGVTAESLGELTDQMYTPGRADNNLRDIKQDDLEAILKAAVEVK